MFMAKARKLGRSKPGPLRSKQKGFLTAKNAKGLSGKRAS
jgi:hypothetical protein